MDWIGEVEHIDLIPTSVSEEPLFKLSFCLIHKKENKKINSTFFLTSYNASEKVVTFTFDAAVKSVSDLQTNNLLNIFQICGQG